MDDVELPFFDGVADVFRHQVFHHFRKDLVAKSRLDDAEWGFARPETRHARPACKFLGNLCDLSINGFLGNLNIEILLAFADVYQCCFHVSLMIASF